MFPIDVLGLGAVAVDDLLYVERYPPADAKARVLRRERHGGGLTATALVAAARLGARCAYAGVLGDDELSHHAARTLEAEHIDLTHLKHDLAARPVYSTIVIDSARHSRNIFFDLNGVVGAAPDWPPVEVIQASRVLFVDYLGLPGMLRAAQIARAAGRPIVADLEAGAASLMDLVDHLILAWEFARTLTGAATPAAAALALWTDQRQVVAITDGDQGCWYVAAEAPGEPRHQPAFPVAVVDTNGCGDVFHGAYAAALARELPVAERFRWAAAAAALKATRPGGQAGAPTLSELTHFLEENHP
jgi:sugar/nucleoside kinase (ribokinase family)